MTILSDIVTGWGVGQALTVLYQLLSRYFDRRVLQRRKWKNSWDISDSVADFWVPLENKRILPGDLVQVHRTALCEIVPLTYWGETRNRYLVNLMEENKARGVDFAHPDRDAFSGRMYNMTLLTLYAGVRLLPRNGIRLIAACYEEGFGDQDGYLFTTANAIPLILPESVYNSILSKRLRAQGSAVCELRAQIVDLPVELLGGAQNQLPREIWHLIPRQALSVSDASQIESVGSSTTIASWPWTLVGAIQNPQFRYRFADVSAMHPHWLPIDKAAEELRKSCEENGEIILTDYDEVSPHFPTAEITPTKSIGPGRRLNG